MKSFKFGHVPPREAGGFHFPQPLPNGGVRMMYGDDKDDLDKKITKFRVDNAIELGDVARETNEYLCNLWPQYCQDDEPGEADETPLNKTLRQRATNWRFNRYSQAQTITEREKQEVAESRADICAKCTYNMPNKDGCGTCVAENDRVFFLLRNGAKTAAEPLLGGCAITGQDNATAVHFVPEMLKYSNQYKDQLPDYCWLKSLHDSTN